MNVIQGYEFDRTQTLENSQAKPEVPANGNLFTKIKEIIKNIFDGIKSIFQPNASLIARVSVKPVKEAQSETLFDQIELVKEIVSNDKSIYRDLNITAAKEPLKYLIEDAENKLKTMNEQQISPYTNLNDLLIKTLKEEIEEASAILN